MAARVFWIFDERVGARTLRGNFKPKRGERGRGKAIARGLENSFKGQIIFCYQNSVDDEAGWVDLGLWWGPPRSRDGSILFCSRWDTGYRLRSVQLNDPRGPVECTVLDEGKSRLLVPVDDAFQLDTMARLLLDEMDRALGA